MDKITWKVASAPTGRYRSFEHRGWPHAYWSDGLTCAFISCEDSYTPARARGEQTHAELVVWVAIVREDKAQWQNCRLKQRCTSLAQAKELVQKFWEANYNLRYFRKVEPKGI